MVERSVGIRRRYHVLLIIHLESLLYWCRKFISVEVSDRYLL